MGDNLNVVFVCRIGWMIKNRNYFVKKNEYRE